MHSSPWISLWVKRATMGKPIWGKWMNDCNNYKSRWVHRTSNKVKSVQHFERSVSANGQAYMGQMGKCTLNHTSRSRDNSTELWKSTQRFQWYRFHKVCNKLTTHPPIWNSFTIITLHPERLRDKVVSEVHTYFLPSFPGSNELNLRNYSETPKFNQ